MLNFNVGLLGHVDSGKTTLAKILSQVSSTAAFDKNPQSKERGITLDLGFSGMDIIAPDHLKKLQTGVNRVQVTFVDCPGHASLIRTMMGGAQIMDLGILVIDAQRGIQAQTAECIVIAEILKRKLIVAVNKIDLLKGDTEKYLKRLENKLRSTFANTIFGSHLSIINISAQDGLNIQELLRCITNEIFVPHRDLQMPLLVYFDHCFPIKGHGNVCTGTIIQGKVCVGDMIEIPHIKLQRKIKSIQIFRRSVTEAVAGDRAAMCVTQFDAKLCERGIITRPDYLKPIYATCIFLERITYYKLPIKFKNKFHMTVGHETVMGSIVLFRDNKIEKSNIFDPNQEYEFVEELTYDMEDNKNVFALIEFEKAILAAPNSVLIATKLDMDTQSNVCRFAFWGKMQWQTHSSQYHLDTTITPKIFKEKVKYGTIQRLVSNTEIIVQNLFDKATNPNLFLGKKVQLSTGETGVIQDKFGKSSKIRVEIKNGLKEATLEKIKDNNFNDIKVIFTYKKFFFHKGKELLQ